MRKKLSTYLGKRKKFYAKVQRFERVGTAFRVLLVNVRDINLNILSGHVWISTKILNDTTGFVGSVICISALVNEYQRRDGSKDIGLKKAEITKIYYSPDRAPEEIAGVYWNIGAQNHG